MNGREPWNEGKPRLLWTPTEGQRYTPAGGAGDSFWLAIAMSALSALIAIWMLID